MPALCVKKLKKSTCSVPRTRNFSISTRFSIQNNTKMPIST